MKNYTFKPYITVTIPQTIWCGNNPPITFNVCVASSPYSIGGNDAYAYQSVKNVPLWDTFEPIDYRMSRTELARVIKQWRTRCKNYRRITSAVIS